MSKIFVNKTLPKRQFLNVFILYINKEYKNEIIMYGFNTGFNNNFNFGMFLQTFNPFPVFNFYNPSSNSSFLTNQTYSFKTYTTTNTFKPISIKDFYSTYSNSLFSTDNNTSSKTTKRTSGDFDTMLKFVLKSEGGYVANDCGQACNKGIQQSTYDAYRTRQGLAKKDVKHITDAEVRDIYYKDYYLASGADKIKDQTLALQVFDTAVNMGVSASKKILKNSNNNSARFADLRIDRYESIAANNKSKEKYLNGWKNRVHNLENYANNEFLA